MNASFPRCVLSWSKVSKYDRPWSDYQDRTQRGKEEFMEEVDRHSFDFDVDNGLILDVLGTIGIAEGIQCFLRVGA